MSGRTLVFVNSVGEAGPAQALTDVVVLDTAWTPAPGERSDLIPVRPSVTAVLERINLFDETLERLDAWGEAAGMADRLMEGGVSWWFHARSMIRLDLHEMLLWCHVLGDLAPPGRYDRIELPAARAFLVTAAQAARPAIASEIVTFGAAAIRRSEDPRPLVRSMSRSSALARLRGPAGRALRSVGVLESRTRMRSLEARLQTLAGEPPAVLAIVRSKSFHVIEDDDGIRREDPYVAPVLGVLAADGRRGVSIGLALEHRHDPDWEIIEADDRLLPMSFVSRRSRLPADDAAIGAAAAARIAGTPELTLEVEGFDLGPAWRSIAADLGPWFERQRQGMLWAERIMTILQPSSLFTGWEGARTMWLGAARRLGVPSLAVQHGIIYPNNPDYYRPRHRGLVRPDVTCVFGSYERDLLIDGGRYDPATVIVTGSPRANPDDTPVVASAAERADLRRELGVADHDRLLVVSAARNPIGDEIHSVSMVARLLGGPLPGIHVTIKLHPEEESGEHYERLLAGLAAAGGYPPVPVSVIRDVDLYRLLRAADAHLGLYSTVLTDAVLTGTPNMVATGQAYADVIDYVEAGVAVPVRSVDEVRAFMAMPIAASPADRARFLEVHYRRGDAIGRIATAIIELAEHARREAGG